MVVKTLALLPSNMPCQPRRVRDLYARKVSFPAKVTAKVVIEKEEWGRLERALTVKINSQRVLDELAAADPHIFRGRTFYHGLLRVKEVTPTSIILEQNPNLSPIPRHSLQTSFEQVHQGTAHFDRELGGVIGEELIAAEREHDIVAIVRLLAEDNPAKVNDKIAKGKIGEVFAKYGPETRKRIVAIIADGILKSFLSVPDQQTAPFKETIERITGKTLEELRTGQFEIPAEALEEALLEGAKAAPLLPAHCREQLAREISETRRMEIIKAIENSALEEGKKRPLLHILSENKFIYLSMFSFTDHLLAGALLASAMRGAEVKVLLDRKESERGSTVYGELVREMERFCALFGIDGKLAPLQVRLYPAAAEKKGSFSSLHLKALILGSGAYQIGSQNWSERGFHTNIEGVLSVEQDADTFSQFAETFRQLWNYLGNVIPFPAGIAGQPWVTRACMDGLVFPEVPPAGAVDRVFRLFSGVRDADISGLLKALAIARGMGVDVVVDSRQKAFGPFRAVIENRLIAETILPKFFEGSPLEFFMAAASRGGSFHPGYTIRIGGLKEHSEMVCEIALQLCRMLGIKGKERDKVILACLLHDAWKNAKVQPDGTVTWAFYNDQHGQAAADRLRKVWAELDPMQIVQFTKRDLDDVCQAIAGHMTIFGKVPQPLLPADQSIRFIVAIADMVASRKYMHIENRAAVPMDRAEAIDRILNNSFSIEGIAWQELKRTPTLYNFLCALLKLEEDYDSLKPRTKMLLRVAESLCKQFELDLKGKPKKETPEEESLRLKRNQVASARRARIFAAAIILGELRYAHGVDEEARNLETFRLRMEDLKDAARRRGEAIPDSLKLAETVASGLADPFSLKAGALTPADDPAFWILHTANCVMVAENLHVVTIDQVRELFASVEPPQTVWQTQRFNTAEVNKLAKGIETLLLKTYREEFIPEIEAMLLEWLNFNRRQRLERIPREVVNSLVDRFGSVFPRLLYEKFYRPMNDSARARFVNDLRAAGGTDPSAAVEALQRLRQQIGPATRRAKTPAAVFGLMARTFMANGISTLDEVKAVLASTRNREQLKQYDYFQGIGAEGEKKFGGIKVGADHLVEALKKGEKISIFGDYDADGELSTVILAESLRTIRAHFLAAQGMGQKEAWKQAQQDVLFHVPHRQHEGYGLNLEFLRKCQRQGVQHVITVDCGIKDKELIHQGALMGIDFIVTDHHDPARTKAGKVDLDRLPDTAVAVVNPKAELERDHPAFNLSGTGVAYKLMLAAVDRANEQLPEKHRLKIGNRYQDLVGASVVTDVCPMLGENRAFVHFGLGMIEKKDPEASRALVYMADKMGLETIDEQAIGFWIGPMLNATGRVGHAGAGVLLLLARDEKIAERYEQVLPYLHQRKEIEEAINRDVHEQLKNPALFDPEKDRGIAVAGNYHRGVIGIVASRLVEEEGLPVVLMGNPVEREFSDTPDEVYGSMRVPDRISAIEILEKCSWRYQAEFGQPLFERFGGHFGAAGFKLKASLVPEFQRLYKEVCREVVGDRPRGIQYVGRFEEGDVSLGRMAFFEKFLGPFGNAFREPLFRTELPIEMWKVFGPAANHIGGNLGEGKINFVVFKGNNRATKRLLLARRAQFVGSWNVSRYRGKLQLKFLVRDVKPAAGKNSEAPISTLPPPGTEATSE